ncbi:methionine aminotransferase [Sphingobacterium sp. SRCM116780]|uniref:methionine aminotransferase n=1 Tax=Sphingobacterium sp. SRCM116780 TaxID=2907623 RepID=UPI001F331539|nr:methionine aminotransferase [Sphingobacterium sp. SRCM116780]UIR55658.1 methionine aminotransferase [Sphingobacterium sp. SRCM116780]
MNLQSKLPHVGTTIFSKMSALAQQHGALNLAQGFPDYETDPYLIELVNRYMKDGFNQYAFMSGVLPLRERIAEKVWNTHQVRVDIQDEITVTAGGTQAIFTAIATVVEKGDEVLIFEPAYDCYAPTVELFGGRVVPVALLAPDFSIDWEYVKSLVNEKTKLIIINNPNNPTGKRLGKEDINALAAIVTSSHTFVLSDEVYEHIVFDGHQPYSLLAHPILRERSFVIASFGKLLHVTGWKVGYCIAPPVLTKEFRKIHQYTVFSVHTAVQMAIAEYLENPEIYLSLGDFFEEKRNYLIEGIQSSKFTVLPSQGTYFLNIDYAAISDEPELLFAERLIVEKKIALIPISAFYTENLNQHILRVCFAKKAETLVQAVDLLNNI